MCDNAYVIETRMAEVENEVSQKFFKSFSRVRKSLKKIRKSTAALCKDTKHVGKNALHYPSYMARLSA